MSMRFATYFFLQREAGSGNLMEIASIVLIALGLSMDAFAVSVGCGIKGARTSLLYPFRLAFSFGFFQAAMPLIGFAFGKGFAGIISSYDHWIAFFLLSGIGIKMIIESFEKDNACTTGAEISFNRMIMLSLATSIDALAAGISFALLGMPIILPSIVIGAVTFAVSLAGVYLGDKVGRNLKKRAELAGGIVLILIGAKILLEHTL